MAGWAWVMVWLVAMLGRAGAADAYVEGEVLVTWRPATTLDGAKTSAGRHSAELSQHFAWLSNHHHRVMGVVRSGTRTTAAMIRELQADPEVLVAEPNYIRHVSVALPNDTYFGNLWGLNNTGQTLNGTAGTNGADIQFPAAWNLAPASSPGEVVVAVMDTGLDTSHPDIVANLWTNSGEIAGNGIDDDGNGYADDVHGYNFVDGNANITDSGYHGSHVAGTIAAVGNNSLGVIGVAYKAHVMVLKVSNDGSTISSSAEISALQYAAMMKARGVNIVAINASFGGGSSSSTESAAIQAAGDAGIVFCAAAGNSTANNDTTPSYPASYRLSNMIVVAASDQNDQLASFSNYGATTVDLAAPGTNIYSLYPTWLASTSASVVQGATTYAAQGLTYAGTTSGITATLINCGTGNSAGEFPGTVRNNIALIQRGTQTFATKLTNAMNAGAVGAIIYNNVAGNFSGTLATNGSWIPAVSVSQADGATLVTLVNTSVTLTNALTASGLYQYLDGTSMATPHVTGAVAFSAMNYPAETAVQRVARVVNHATAVPALAGKVKTGGRLNLYNMIDTVSSLAALTVSGGTLSPAFASATTAYSVSVGNATTSVTVTPTLTDTRATMKVNGVTVTSGTASAAIPLAVGANPISVVVTALNGTTTTNYTVTVTRAASAVSTLASLTLGSGTLSPTFASGTLSYTASVGNAVTAVTVTPVLTDATATIKVNGVAVASGSASAALPLAVGGNPLSVVVTAQNGITTTTYTVTVTRAASAVSTLASLTASSGSLSPTFASGTISYTASVGNAVTSVTVTPVLTDSTATIKVNGVAVASGSASAALPLAVGGNPLSVVVTAQNGITTTTYTVTVTRAPSSVATLAALTVSGGSLIPAFVSTTTSYVGGMAAVVASVTVTPTVTEPHATVKVNGTTVLSGAASAALPLVAGSNVITVSVTAQDGVTSTAYLLTIDNTAYGVWKSSAFTNPADLENPAVSGDMATPAHDGITNLMKYALALAPRTSGTGGLPTASPQGGYLTLTYRKNKSATDVSYTVQASDALSGPWTTAATVTSQVDEGSYTLVTIRDTVADAGHPRRFMRLQVSR